MVQRIGFDYMNLRDTYQRELGFVPEAYALMHANTTQFGNQDDVARSMKSGSAGSLPSISIGKAVHSNAHNSPYDLTRLEPGTKWPVNHLLMRVAASAKHGEDSPLKKVTAPKKSGNTILAPRKSRAIPLSLRRLPMWADRTIGQQSVSKFQLIRSSYGAAPLAVSSCSCGASEDCCDAAHHWRLSGRLRLIATERRHGKDTPLLQKMWMCSLIGPTSF